MRPYEYFSGKKQDFTFWSKKVTSQKQETQPKGLKKGKTSSKGFGQGSVGECLVHKKPQQAMD